MTMDSKVPEIRFKGFSKNWNQRKLDTIFGKIRNAFVGTATPYYVKEGHFYLESNNVKDGKINRKNEIFINNEFYYKQSDKWLREGDIVMVQSGHVGHTAVVPPELNNIAAHALIMFTAPKEEISSHFINVQFQTNKVKAKLSEITTGNTIKHILSSEMKEFEMLFSDYEEQTQIGNYFLKLDGLIDQHQQKHGKLNNIKKSMLEKMFPKPGETVPEIRFKGFSGDWNEVALSDVIDVRSGKDYKHLGKGNIPVYGTGGYMLSVNSALSNNADAIGIGRKGTIDKPYILRAPFWTVDTLFYSVPFSGFNLDFLFCLFQKIDWKKHDESTGVPSLSKIAINNMTVYATNKLEQTAIGNYFQKLDKLINQHQQQITKLNNIKQACLSKMFV